MDIQKRSGFVRRFPYLVEGCSRCAGRAAVELWNVGLRFDEEMAPIALSGQAVPYRSPRRPEILKTPVLRDYTEALQKCLVPVLGEGVRFQWRKTLDRFTMFNAIRLRYAPSMTSGQRFTVSWSQRWLPLGTAHSNKNVPPGLPFNHDALLLVDTSRHGRHDGCADYSPATSISSLQWSLAPHSSTEELRARTVTFLWKPR